MNIIENCLIKQSNKDNNVDLINVAILLVICIIIFIIYCKLKNKDYILTGGSALQDDYNYIYILIIFGLTFLVILFIVIKYKTNSNDIVNTNAPTATTVTPQPSPAVITLPASTAPAAPVILPAPLPEDDTTKSNISVLCGKNDIKGRKLQNRYKYNSNKILDWYPNNAIAQSHDPLWDRPQIIDCTGFSRGINLRLNRATDKTYNCTDTTTLNLHPLPNNKYKLVYENGDFNLKWYPNDIIAAMHDPQYISAPSINCEGINVSDNPMEHRKIIDNSYKCIDNKTINQFGTNNIFRYTVDNTIRNYPSNLIAQSWDINYMNAPSIECSNMKYGTPLEYNYQHNKSYRCNEPSALSPNTTFLYRNSGTIPQYSKYKIEAIADSWDTSWKTAPLVDCSDIQLDNRLNLKGIKYGSIIKCSSGLSTDGQYIYLNNTGVTTINGESSLENITAWYGNQFSTINCNGLTEVNKIKVPPKDDTVKITCDNNGNQYTIPTTGNTLNDVPQLNRSPTPLPINCSNYTISTVSI